MIKGIVFDKDGSLYSARPYINPLANHLIMHPHVAGHADFRFWDCYHWLKEEGVIGRRYDPITFREKGDGRRLNNAFTIPFVVAMHYNLSIDSRMMHEMFGEFSEKYMFEHPDFSDVGLLVNILSNHGLKTAVVSNDRNTEAMLKKLGIHDLFNLIYSEANKRKNLDRICADIESKFQSTSSGILWVEDDIPVLERLKAKGYQTALRKTQGFNYPPESELKVFADIILEDDLRPLQLLLDQDGSQ